MNEEIDSSDAASDTYSATNVLLGYAAKEPTDDEFSQLGGFPVCFDASIDKNSLQLRDLTSTSDMARFFKPAIVAPRTLQELQPVAESAASIERGLT